MQIERLRTAATLTVLVLIFTAFCGGCKGKTPSVASEPATGIKDATEEVVPLESISACDILPKIEEEPVGGDGIGVPAEEDILAEEDLDTDADDELTEVIDDIDRIAEKSWTVAEEESPAVEQDLPTGLAVDEEVPEIDETGVGELPAEPDIESAMPESLEWGEEPAVTEEDSTDANQPEADTAEDGSL